MISIARPGRPFSERQRELFAYLTNQAAISIENVDLHETIQRQAVTDELTGLFNHRRFQEVMTAEVERTRRFGQELGLIMFDIDDFKRVNDTYGHLQGDVVLREVAGSCASPRARSTSRPATAARRWRSRCPRRAAGRVRVRRARAPADREPQIPLLEGRARCR